METISILTVILAVLMVLIGGKQGFSAFFSVLLNFGLLFLTIILISSGFPPLWTSLFSGVCILAITIYMGTSDEKAANVAFLATLCVMIVMLLLIIPLDHVVQVKGFANEQSEEIEAFNLMVGVDFEKIAISTTVLSTLGAIAEAAIAIASGLNEVIEQDPHIERGKLYESGQNIGFQIMGMTFNTLFFGMFGGDLALFILLNKLHNSFGYYLNSKIFVSECMLVLYSAISVILVIFFTTWLMGRKRSVDRGK
ncbi:MAG TPA: YibE/F family protein [Ligilactobacillus acidipiscis]|uniref:YibE/F family protein n=1 Tax=Ligilactobacillus acidipiscis TaxID=89059 RepID=A0A921K1P8_9LACO|nr:YibE/F family protein [Ligilactobacillus acidipiscis]